jgi:hypothetical protein
MNCRNLELEKNCSAMLDVQYGPAAASIIRSSHLLEHPLRLVVNQAWDRQVDGGSALVTGLSSMMCWQCCGHVSAATPI